MYTCSRALTLATSAVLGLGNGAVEAGTTFYGPTPYLSFADSPFKDLSLAQFYLETFEDGTLNSPGVAITNNKVGGSQVGVLGPGTFYDSVDADDGVVDGFGRNGHSYGSLTNEANGSAGLTISFNAATLGGLPTHVGLVWTDGSPTASTIFEAFDGSGLSLGTIGPVKIGDSSFAGTTAEDRFFGVSSASGVFKVTIRDPGSVHSIEIDHVQYGLPAPAVPEPSSIVLLSLGLTCMAYQAWRSKLRGERGRIGA